MLAHVLGFSHLTLAMKIKAFFQSVWTQTKDAFSRYPLSMLLILAGFGLGQYMIWMDFYDTPLEETLLRVQMTIWITLPLFTAIQLFHLRKWTLLLAALLGVTFYWLQTDVYTSVTAERTMLWGLAFYAALLFLPRWKKDPNNGFWVYVERLAFILALALLCTLILTASLQLALFSIRVLFEVNFDYRWEETIWMFGFLIFLPVFAHVGLPSRYREFESVHDYPSFVKPIAYYLLLPISFLYLGILGVYVAQILITREWPSGQVAYPVLYLSMVIFATYFLSYPWQKPWLKWGFAILLPFLGVYFIALYQRIAQYGLTEMRYLGVLFGLVLTGLCFYYLRSKEKRLQLAFLTIALTAFVFSFGPLGVFDLAVRSQVARLEMLLTEIGALQDGKIQEIAADSVSDATVVEISGVVEYLASRDRLDEVEEWGDIRLGTENQPDVDVRTSFMEQMGLEFNTWWGGHYEDPLYFQYGAQWPLVYDVAGYDALLTFDQNFDDYGYKADPATYAWNSEEDNVTVSLDESGNLLITYEGSTLTFSLLDLHEKFNADGKLDKFAYESEELSLSAENEKMRVKIYIENMDGSFTSAEETEFSRMYVRGQVMLDVK